MFRFIICRWVRHRLPLYLDDSVDDRTKDKIQTHLLTCSGCQKELEEYKFAFDMLDAYFRKKRLDAAIRRIDPKIAELYDKEQEVSPEPKESFIKRYALPFAAAASIILVIGISIIARHLQYQNQQVMPPSPQIISTVSSNIGTYTLHHVYLCEDNMNNGSIPLMDKGTLSTNNMHKMTVKLLGNHEIILDFNTEVTFRKEEDINTKHSFYSLNLSKGHIWVNKAKSQEVLIVQTPQSQVQATGTIFDVQLPDMTKTILTVGEGVVLFSANKTSLQLTSGEQSIVENNNPPTLPQMVDTNKLLAWVRELGPIATNITSTIKEIKERLFKQTFHEGDKRSEALLLIPQNATLLSIEKELIERGKDIDRDILIGLTGAIFQVSYPKDISGDILNEKSYSLSNEGIQNIMQFYQTTTPKDSKEAILNSLGLAGKYANEPEDKDYYNGIRAYEKWIEDIQTERRYENEIAWQQEMILYVSKASAILSEKKDVAQRYIEKVKSYLKDTQANKQLRDIEANYKEQIRLLNELSTIILDSVSRNREISKDPHRDQCEDLFLIDRQTKEAMSNLLTEILVKEREVVEWCERLKINKEGWNVRTIKSQ